MIINSIKPVGPALFFGEDAEVAESAIAFQEALAALIQGHAAMRDSDVVLSCRAGVFLPGYYRPEVRWSICVYSGDVLIAVVWVVNDVWPFLATNFNIIIAETVSSGVDLQRAFDDGQLGGTRPLVCLYICVEDCLESRLVGPGPASPEDYPQGIVGRSYLRTYQEFCRRLLSSGLYDVACFATSARTSEGVQLYYPVPEFSLDALESKISEYASQRPK